MKPSGILVRHYNPSDVPALVALFRDSVRQIARRDYSEEQVNAWAPDEIDHNARAARHASRPTWVVERDDILLGFTDLEPDGHLDCMYVHAGYQRQGIASALLLQVEIAAREQGLKRLYCEVSITARPFFERRGFRLIAPQTVTVRGQALINFRMEKCLNSD